MSSTYVDGTTPLDAAHMNALQQKVEKGAPSGYAPLDSGSKVPTANLPDLSATYQPISQKGQPNGYVGLDGSSNATLPANLVVNGAAMIGATLYLGSAYDTSLYRIAANVLATQGYFQTRVGTAEQIGIGYIGGSQGCGISFGASFDANLYRSAANSLKTDGYLTVGQAIHVDNSDTSQPLFFGSGTDTKLWKKSNRALYADADLWCRYHVVIAEDNASKMWFGSALDTNLYRSAANHLKTDGFLHAGLNVVAFDGNTTTQAAIGNYGPSGQAALNLGTAGDTVIYRAAAGVLKTDGILNAVGGLQINGVPVGGASEIAYVAAPSNVNASTSPGTVVCDTGSIAYDGTPVMIEFYAPLVGNQNTPWDVRLQLYDGATSIGALWMQGYFQSGNFFCSAHGRMKITPTAGSHNYRVLAMTISGANAVVGGDGSIKAYMRITKA